MSNDDKVELNKEVAKQIFELANMSKATEATDENMLHALVNIKTALSPQGDTTYNPTSNNILVIDDIGVVTYQLKILLRNLGYNVQIAKDIFTGLNAFIKMSFAFVIMDLFVSTEQEGYTLLHETKKIITQNNLDTKIIVITASNKVENKVKCINGGADYFIKKDSGWQDKIIELVDGAQNKE